MKSMKPTKTTNRIHFEDLSPLRFEDLSMALIYRMNRWLELNHLGRLGKDDGIDIHAVQELENGSRKTWYIQCKRYKRLIQKDFDEMLGVFRKRKVQAPDVFLLITSCDISSTHLAYFKKVSSENGIMNAIVWSASTLEAKLYAENHDLLFAYFEISLTIKDRSRVASIRRNIEMKRKLRSELIRDNIDFRTIGKSPYNKFVNSNLIIRSMNDTTYPEMIDNGSSTISPWFKVEPYDFYHNGIGVVLSIRYAVFNDADEWDLVEFGREIPDEVSRSKVFKVGQIPFDNIVAYDDQGDEYFPQPHLYCDFRNNGMPYEGFSYHTICDDEIKDDCYPVQLDLNKRKIGIQLELTIESDKTKPTPQ